MGEETRELHNQMKREKEKELEKEGKREENWKRCGGRRRERVEGTS